MGVLIDTCIWVDVERGIISPADVEVYTKKNPVFISPVTIAELTFGIEMAKNADIRYKRLSAINRLKKKPILLIDELTGDIFGKIAAYLLQKKRRHEHRIQDIWLASQSIQYDFSFLTRNAKDFNDIPGLKLIPLESEQRVL
jgi:predicted nucleic acid-binding protein